MKPVVTAIILFASIQTSFAGNFTPIPKNKTAQIVDCTAGCGFTFDTCVRVRGTGGPSPTAAGTAGTQQVATPTRPIIIGPSCEFDRDACLRGCASIRTSPPG